MSRAPSDDGPPARRQRTLLGFLKMSNLRVTRGHTTSTGQPGPTDAKGDWPRRIAEYARDDQEDAAAYAANY